MSIISILIPVAEYHVNYFKGCLHSIIKTCSNIDKIEVIIKVDSIESKNKCNTLLKSSGVRYRIVYNNKVGYKNVPIFFNQMIHESIGDILWGLGSDCRIDNGDWVKGFLNTRNIYEDNIYAINSRPNATLCLVPAISKEWYDTLGYFTPHGALADILIHKLSRNCHRSIDVHNIIIRSNIFGCSQWPKKMRKQMRRKTRQIYVRDLSKLQNAIHR